jgi:hypothetical protein
MFKPEKIAQKKRDLTISLLPVFTGLGSGRGGRIRTYDLLLPKQARYRATLHPEKFVVLIPGTILAITGS